MNLTSHLPADRREHVETRLRVNVIAWLTTMRPSGQPETVPVWFLVREDETILIFSEPGKGKLRNIAKNPKVSLVLDVTDLGRDVIRIEGTAQQVDEHPAANQIQAYVAKYTERIGALFGASDEFAARYSSAVVITPSKLHA